MSDDFGSFDEFWPFYVHEHSKKTTRWLHFAGTTMALGAAVAGVLTRRARYLLLAPVLGYGPAWVGHFFVERNTPATFEHPLWSLQADFVMYSKMWAGTMDAEVERVMADYAAQRDDASDEPDEVQPSNGASKTAEGHHPDPTLN